MLIAVALLYFSAFGLQNWQVYTNTNHIFDLQLVDNKIFMATWGGLEVYDFDTASFEKTRTTIDGLASNDLRAIDYYENANEFLLGSFGGGIDRFDGNNFNLPLTEILGLGSDYVHNIAHQDSLIFAVTTVGISLFKESQSFPFPLLISNFDIDNGLSSNQIYDLELSENFLFLATGNGVDYVHLDSLLTATAWHNINTSNSNLPSNFTYSLSVKNSRIAIATDLGLLDIADFHSSFTGNLLLENQSVYPVYIDNENNLWFSYCSWDQEKLILENNTNIAVTRIDENGQETVWLQGEGGLNTNLVKGFMQSDDKFIVYTWGEGLFIFQNENWEKNIKPNCISANIVADLEIDENKKLWVASGYLGLEQLGKGTNGVCSYDGELWQAYTRENYPALVNNNVVDIEIDYQNRKWFCSYQYINPGTGGISIFDDNLQEWEIPANLPSNYTTELFLDSTERMWVSAFGNNFVLDTTPTINVLGSFLSNNDDENLSTITFVDEETAFFGSYAKGLEYWTATSIPYANGSFWETAPSAELNSGTILDIKQRRVSNLKETWIASTNGLFMFDGEDWFLYGTNAKMSVWLNNQWYWSQDNPDPTYWYYEGQERLYGSHPTYPTCLFIDPFGRIWIGTAEFGITIFDKEADTFTNITSENSPLISDNITAFTYEEHSGTLYIGTLEGITSVEIGVSAENNFEENLNKIIAFPNPFHPENGEVLRIENQDSFTMPRGNTFCRIYDLNGEFIVELEKNIYEQFSWDGKNKDGKKCGSGLYYYVVAAPGGQTGKGKILLIR